MTETVTYKDKQRLVLTLNNGMRITATYRAEEDCFYWGRVKVERSNVSSVAET